MSENQTLIATADAEHDPNLIPIVEPEVTGTTSIDVDGDVGRISVVGTADDASIDPMKANQMPDKFANAEDPQAALLKAYQELEKSQGTKPAEATPEVEGESAKVEPEVPSDTDRAKATKVEEYSKLWADQNGSLTDDQWGTVSKDLNIAVDDLKGYEAYRKSEISSGENGNDAKIYEVAGGEDKYQTMIDWASGNMNDAQLDAGDHSPIQSQSDLVFQVWYRSDEERHRQVGLL
jgi:hypothetical protein